MCTFCGLLFALSKNYISKWDIVLTKKEYRAKMTLSQNEVLIL